MRLLQRPRLPVSVIHSPFAAAFVAGTRFRHERDGEIVMRTATIGELIVPSGSILVADPFTTDFDPSQVPLARQAPVGVFPVDLAIACFDNCDERVACARVRFADAAAVRWEAAGFAGEAPAADSEPSGYGVDAGMGCFADLASCTPQSDTPAEAWLTAVERGRVETWSAHVAALGQANVVMFSSGWGDGIYSSYWGLDAAGQIVELVTDFAVLLEPLRERIELPLPLPLGKVVHPLLAARRITVRRPLLSRTSAIVSGGLALLQLSDGSPIAVHRTHPDWRWTWKRPAPDVRLRVLVRVGTRPCVPLPGDAA